MLLPRSILVEMRVALIPGRIVREMTPDSASSTVMDERRSVLAEDRDVRDLLDRHHDGSEIHGQLALSANVSAAAQASIMRMRRNPPGLDLPLAPNYSACRFNLRFDLRKLCAEPIKRSQKVRRSHQRGII
jgi:hypothetical protein